MKGYDICAEVKFYINWREPAKDTSETIMRNRAQCELDVKAGALSDALATVLTITTIDTPETE